MSLDGALTYIKTQMDTIPNIGKVVCYEPWYKMRADFDTAFKYTTGGKSYIRAWILTRIRKTNIRVSFPLGKEYTDTIMIKGFHELSMSENTEKTFQGLIDNVVDKVVNLGNVNGNATWCGLPQVLTIEHKQILEVVCHYCEITIDMRLRTNVTG